MALVDYSNKVIYWDEVNWHWLPYVMIGRNGHCYFLKGGISYPITCKEDVVRILKSFDYCLYSIQVLGISEISQNLFLYKGKLYEVSNLKPSIITLISNITGKASSWISRKIRGRGVLSETIFDELLLGVKVKYNGKSYKGYNHLAKELGIPYSAIYTGLSEGKSLDEIIENRKPRKVKDHLGSQFESTKEMISRWGISRETYNKRLSDGWSLEKTLTTPVSYANNTQKCRDHLGNEFESKGAMYKAYGVSRATFSNRLLSGWSLEEALTGSRNENNKYVDFKGNAFPSKTKMAEHWGISYPILRDRLGLGWTLEEALTGTRKSKK